MKTIYMSILSLCLAFGITNCAIFSSISTASQSLDSISTSVASVLGSISKSLGSISKSSAPKDDEKSSIYRKDVETIVSLYAKDQELLVTLEDDIARIAEKNGIVSWREYRGTYTAFGSGLKQAGYSLDEVREITQISCPEKPELADAILEGFNS
ncbi:MAG: putative lipoprotein [Leptospira sp.]|nr:putative lipoprotein [Leptospira sp.]